MLLSMSQPCRLHLPLWPSILVLGFLLLTVTLGFWQLRRGVEKQQTLERVALASAQGPVSLVAALASPEPMVLRVLVEGLWQPSPVFLLENQSHEGRRGVHVLQWLEPVAGERLLVDRGWQIEPVLMPAPASAGAVTLHGHLYQPGEPLLKPVVDTTQPIVRLPVLDMAVVQAGRSAAPYLLRLDADSPDALQANWHQGGMTPAKHRGYAVTWFCLAAALLLLYCWWLYTLRSNPENDVQNRSS